MARILSLTSVERSKDSTSFAVRNEVSDLVDNDEPPFINNKSGPSVKSQDCKRVLLIKASSRSRSKTCKSN
jgi:hypothetical protein